ncbi:MAG: glutamine--tRNA ligase/YqeY domain fusion protein [Spirochaetaceae bacterium]|nr:MAG: glutamine--tRNA ligase/YqeY domain fusion protein [Spirochaetaceae bacterium]
MSDSQSVGTDFIRARIVDDLKSGRFSRVQTRWPPEPNGYIHIGHAKGIWLSFGIAEDFGGACKLRFDDTNPTRENEEYVRAIEHDVRWLGYQWEEVVFASDYYQQLFDWAVLLINAGSAYVDSLSREEISAYRGSPTEPGRNSPFRDRTIGENLDLFNRMRAGEFADGTHVLRAKIDMAHPNINMRDPVMYRILHAHHHRTGDAWCIYPTYDWAHGQSDSIECVSHSICGLEFENHRPLYDWFLDQLGVWHPQQIEYNNLNITYTMMSKRRLRALVEERIVDGWDDPRMPTLRGMRRRGYTPTAIRAFLEKVGLSKTEVMVDAGLLDFCQREELNQVAPRVMVVLDPIKVVITNYPQGQQETFDAENNPEDATAGTRPVSFSREIYIERDDFTDDPPPKYFRLFPGGEVRLKHAYYVTCTDVIRDASGEVVQVNATYDPESRGGQTPDGRKVKGTLHWVNAAEAVAVEVRLFDRLWTREDMVNLGDLDFRDFLNPQSRLTVTGALAEPGAIGFDPGTRLQFMRHGYFCVDEIDTRPGAPVFNRTTSLRDTWAKAAKR